MSRRKAKGWHPEDIKAAIRKKGQTLTGLALDNGLRASACREALLYPVPAADKVISDFLGVTPQSLWPDRYDETGQKRPTIVGKRKRQKSTIVGKRGRKTGRSQRLSDGLN